MADAPNVQSSPELVSPDTVDNLLTAINTMTENQPLYPLIGRATWFDGEFDGQASRFFVNQTPIETRRDGLVASVRVTPAGDETDANSTDFNFRSTTAGVLLKKHVQLDLSGFSFETSYEQDSEEYEEARKRALEEYIAAQRKENEDYGLDDVYEPEAQELLRVLEKELRLHPEHAQGAHPDQMRASVGAWLRGKLRSWFG